MNYFIEIQCKNMITSVEIFEKACDLAARKDDGKLSKEEAKILKHIHQAAKKFKKNLHKIDC